MGEIDYGGKLSLVLMGGAMLSKSLIQFSVDGQGNVSSLLFKVKMKSLSVRLFATPWTVAHQASPSMGFSRQEYWSGLPFPSPSIFYTQPLMRNFVHTSKGSKYH